MRVPATMETGPEGDLSGSQRDSWPAASGGSAPCRIVSRNVAPARVWRAIMRARWAARAFI